MLSKQEYFLLGSLLVSTIVGITWALCILIQVQTPEVLHAAMALVIGLWLKRPTGE
jgi:hypothetical protein